MTAFIIVASLVFFLPTVVTLHRFGQRRAERLSGRIVPTQGVALKAVLLGWATCLGELTAANVWGGLSVAWSLWAILVVGGMGFCYWSLVCITESGRRYMITELVALNPGITPEAIMKRYDRHQILATRLERLEHWKTLTLDNGVYRSRPTTMLTTSVLVRFWAATLGFSWPQDLKKEP